VPKKEKIKVLHKKFRDNPPKMIPNLILPPI
jgi:hypothetical protein